MKMIFVLLCTIHQIATCQDLKKFEPIFGGDTNTEYKLDSLVENSDKCAELHGVWGLNKKEGKTVKDSSLIEYKLTFTKESKIILNNVKNTYYYTYNSLDSTILLFYSNKNDNSVKSANVKFHIKKVNTNKLKIIWGEGFTKVEGELWTFKKI